MMKQVSATDAKNNFGGLLEDVATLGRVDIVRHGRVVAIVMSPRAIAALQSDASSVERTDAWGATHMIPPELARTARVVSELHEFDDEED